MKMNGKIEMNPSGENNCISKRFIGPKALFDPFFVPEYLVDREQEEQYLNGLLNDAVVDNFPANIGVFGIKGSGKTVLINKTIENLAKSTMKTGKAKSGSNKKTEPGFVPFFVNCEDKETNQIIFSMVSSLANHLNYTINSDVALNSSASQLWNIFKLLCSKQHEKFAFVLDSVEYANPKILNKISETAASDSVIMINSFNVPQSSPFLMDFRKPDFKVEMNTYSHSNLLKITKDRCEVAIKHPVEDTMLKYITDLVCEFDKKVPGSTIRVVKELYPILEHNKNVSGNQIRDICRYQFEGYSIDELSIAEFISESELRDRVFLDNICTYFNKSEEYYISYKYLRNSFKLACESLEDAFSEPQFNSTIKKLYNISLLIPSSLDNQDTDVMKIFPDIKSSLPKKNIPNINSSYFLTVPPEFLGDMLDVAFGNVEEI
jgi:Cdc6-like AAA superfamily ATPase